MGELEMSTQLALLRQGFEAHVGDDKASQARMEKTVEDNQARTETTLAEIKTLVTDIGKTLRESTARLHEKREETAMELRGEIAVVAKKAGDAHEAAIGVKLWTLAGVATALAAALSTVIGWIKH